MNSGPNQLKLMLQKFSVTLSLCFCQPCFSLFYSLFEGHYLYSPRMAVMNFEAERITFSGGAKKRIDAISGCKNVVG